MPNPSELERAGESDFNAGDLIEANEVYQAAAQAGLRVVESCCGTPEKFCSSDVWKGNLRSFAKNIARIVAASPSPSCQCRAEINQLNDAVASVAAILESMNEVLWKLAKLQAERRAESKPAPETVRVRIAVWVSDDGDYRAMGASGQTGEYLEICVKPKTKHGRTYFVEADLPVPPRVPRTVRGEVVK